MKYNVENNKTFSFIVKDIKQKLILNPVYASINLDGDNFTIGKYKNLEIDNINSENIREVSNNNFNKYTLLEKDKSIGEIVTINDVIIIETYENNSRLSIRYCYYCEKELHYLSTQTCNRCKNA